MLIVIVAHLRLLNEGFHICVYVHVTIFIMLFDTEHPILSTYFANLRTCASGSDFFISQDPLGTSDVTTWKLQNLQISLFWPKGSWNTVNALLWRIGFSSTPQESCPTTQTMVIDDLSTALNNYMALMFSLNINLTFKLPPPIGRHSLDLCTPLTHATFCLGCIWCVVVDCGLKTLTNFLFLLKICRVVSPNF